MTGRLLVFFLRSVKPRLSDMLDGCRQDEEHADKELVNVEDGVDRCT